VHSVPIFSIRRGRKKINQNGWVNMIVDIMYLWRPEQYQCNVLHRQTLKYLFLWEMLYKKGPYDLKTNTEINQFFSCMFEQRIVFKRHPMDLPTLLFTYWIQELMIYVAAVGGVSRHYCEKYINLRKAEYNGTVTF